MESNPTAALKRSYASSARAVGRGLTRVGLLPAEAPSRDRRLRHWAFSLTRAHDSVAIAALDVPWWTYRAIDVVDAWLAARPAPIRVFEWGSGANTMWLARRSAEVTSVEHHAGFADFMRPHIDALDNATVRVIEPDPMDDPVIGSHKEGHRGLDFSRYVAAIDDVGGRFDVIVVDGRAREACLTRAIDHLAPDGIIIFDNSRRRRYRVAIDAAPVTERRLPGLTPTLPYPDQTSILTIG